MEKGEKLPVTYLSRLNTWARSLIVLVFIALGGVIWGIVGASPDRPVCDAWNTGWYHHRTTPEHVRSCLRTGRAQINQGDERGRTLLHRLAVDIAGNNNEEYWDQVKEGAWVYRTEGDGNSRGGRMQIVEELLRWEELDINAPDTAGRPAWWYAMRKSKGWALAAILTEAGAAVQVTERDEETIRDTWLPVFRFARDRAVGLLGEEVDLGGLATCETAECVADVVIPDLEVQRAPAVQEQSEEERAREFLESEGAVRMLPYRPAWGVGGGTPEE